MPDILTKHLMFGMNLLSLAGFVLMGISMTLVRQQKIRTPLGFALMSAGTGLLFVGLYLEPPA